jgi:hypothetical protein
MKQDFYTDFVKKIINKKDIEIVSKIEEDLDEVSKIVYGLNFTVPENDYYREKVAGDIISIISIFNNIEEEKAGVRDVSLMSLLDEMIKIEYDKYRQSNAFRSFTAIV